MKYNNFLPLAAVPILVAAYWTVNSSINAKEIFHLPMDPSAGTLTESVKGINFDIFGAHSPEHAKGTNGNAFRLDGYSSYAEGETGSLLNDASAMTANVRFALETYPIVMHDQSSSEQVPIVSSIDDTTRTGFGFFVGFDGRYSFKTYVGGWPLELNVSTPLKTYEWINLTAVVDADTKTATLYNNGEVVASGRANGNVSLANSKMRIGRSFNERFSGQFCLTSINGIIDEVSVYDEAMKESDIKKWDVSSKPQLAVDSERFANDPMRPQFHGMPSANWTNESHGMTYSDGRFHLFFQKNGNGPYMSRLHWGHISSENLFDWQEEKIALIPGDSYDIKGCWSGCVFSDDEITGGKPSIIYTGVDYVRAYIAMANPKDESLENWTKVSSNPIINGRPDGLSDDFRDPYFFRTDAGAYIIVGSSKNNIGTTTLHKYDPATKKWSNDGKTFFSGSNASTCGTFWEMPNITKIGDKWLFTTTPQNTQNGVATLYWTGSINSDGTFQPDNLTPATVEFPSYARDGYGLLSPTIYQHDGKTIALGIVPDKLPGKDNYELGYAHTYSLPREWSIDNDGNLVQKPYSGLSAMRDSSGESYTQSNLNGEITFDKVSGRAIELLGEFNLNGGRSGFKLLDDGNTALLVYFDADANEIVVDASSLSRRINDSRSFNGIYRSALPKRLNKGDKLKLNVFFDHSILDIFVNDTWASSVRVFAYGKDTESAAAFSTMPIDVDVKGWNLKKSAGNSGVQTVTGDTSDMQICAGDSTILYSGITTPSVLYVYDTTGAKLFEKALSSYEGEIYTGHKGLKIITLLSQDGISVSTKAML